MTFIFFTFILINVLKHELRTNIRFIVIFFNIFPLTVQWTLHKIFNDVRRKFLYVYVLPTDILINNTTLHGSCKKKSNLIKIMII